MIAEGWREEVREAERKRERVERERQREREIIQKS